MGLEALAPLTFDLVPTSGQVPAHPTRSAGAAGSRSLAELSDRDRRAHERHPAHELEWLRSIRLKFGPSVSIVDLSSGGALIETTMPLRPGSTTALTIQGRGIVETTSFRVLRCEVASISRGLVYRGACVFERTLALPNEIANRDPGGPLETTAQSIEFQRAREMIREKATGLTSGVLRASWASLLADVDAAIRRGEPVSQILAFIEKRIGRRAIRPAAASSSLIELPRDQQRLAVSPLASRVEEPSRDAPLPADGWSRLVVKYLDGRLLKGFSQDFHPSRTHFHLARTIQSSPQQPVLVPVTQLKAVFFVRDFAGDATYAERKSFADVVQGRRIEVTFLDDEVMVGSTLSYRPQGSGFFLTPADSNGNNLRVFIGPSAVRHVRYL
jgi:uncharacterized protein DUF6982